MRIDPVEFFGFVQLPEAMEVLDVGAALIAEVPVYRHLIDRGVARLHAFDGDERQIQKLRSAYGNGVMVHNAFLFDGTEQTLYLCGEPTGMTSLLKPHDDALRFFNEFERFGRVERVAQVQTTRLDDIAAVPPLDFVKMDIQGAELTVLQNGIDKLGDAVAVQLEVSWICLYENQPAFGEVDTWMRAHGFQPHTLLATKNWSIRPTIFQGNFRVAGNQLLESDIVYVKDPLRLDVLTDLQLTKLAILTHECFRSVDLCVHVLRELARRGLVPDDAQIRYYEFLAGKSRAMTPANP